MRLKSKSYRLSQWLKPIRIEARDSKLKKRTYEMAAETFIFS